MIRLKRRNQLVNGVDNFLRFFLRRALEMIFNIIYQCMHAAQFALFQGKLVDLLYQPGQVLNKLLGSGIEY